MEIVLYIGGEGYLRYSAVAAFDPLTRKSISLAVVFSISVCAVFIFVLLPDMALYFIETEGTFLLGLMETMLQGVRLTMHVKRIFMGGIIVFLTFIYSPPRLD